VLKGKRISWSTHPDLEQPFYDFFEREPLTNTQYKAKGQRWRQIQTVLAIQMKSIELRASNAFFDISKL
jgi:hypothetical protein